MGADSRYGVVGPGLVRNGLGWSVGVVRTGNYHLAVRSVPRSHFRHAYSRCHPRQSDLRSICPIRSHPPRDKQNLGHCHVEGFDARLGEFEF